MHRSASTRPQINIERAPARVAPTSPAQERRRGANERRAVASYTARGRSAQRAAQSVPEHPGLSGSTRIAPEKHELAALCDRYAAAARVLRVPKRPRDAGRAPRRPQQGSWHLGTERPSDPRRAGLVDVAGVLVAIAGQLSTPQGAASRDVDGSRIATTTLLAFATVDLLAADRDTGRNVATSHETAARLATTLTGRARPYSPKTAQRARTVLQRLGWMVEVSRGRRLTLEECADARAAHGRTQVMAASTRDWIIPDTLLIESIVHQPSTAVNHATCLSESTPNRATARPEAGTKQPVRPRRPSSAHGPRFPITTQRFAGELARRLPWLDLGHVGRICGAVRAAGIDTGRWTVPDLMQALEHVNRELGREQLPAGRMRDPLAWFVDAARFAVRLLEASGDPLPSETRRAAALDRAARIAAWQAELSAAEAAASSVNTEERDRAIEAMHKAFPPSPEALKRAARTKKSAR